MNIYILMLLFFLLSYAPVFASSIIVFRNNNEIVIGTDSKR